MKTKTDLLPHQRAAVDKLKGLKIGALYMEMGTGKTRTALELIKLRLDAGKISRVLWLCPCSVKGNLEADIHKHASELNETIVICGIETLSGSSRTATALLNLVRSESVMLVVDESTLVKNPFALRSKRITCIAESCQYKLILNGTPVTKCEADLFSQWYILDWRVLGYQSFYSFAANHLEYDVKNPHRIVRALNTDYLVRKIEPYTYQCTKAEVMQLPAKTTVTREFSLTEEQDEHYQYVIDTLLNSPDEMQDIDIYQFFGALQSVTSGFSVTITQTRKGFKVTRERMFTDPLDNPRIGCLLSVLDAIPAEDKVIIFCTYTAEIDDVVAVLNARKPGSAAAFNGEIPQKKRQAVIDDFRDHNRFLVANKTCGAFGLNLQFCHRLVFFSHDWNWGTRVQAEDRVHRFGQTEAVEIVNLEARRTLDARILRCLDKKENLADSFKTELTQQNRESLAEFLRGGTQGGESLRQAECIRGTTKKA